MRSDKEEVREEEEGVHNRAWVRVLPRVVVRSSWRFG